MSAYDTILAYHHATKHRHGQYARGPETLDWDAQPAPFRHYAGAPVQPLPLSAARYEVSFHQLHRPNGRRAAEPLSLDAISALLHLSLGIAAWKSNGVDRWSVRCNPSSGNLHPTEAYLICTGIPGIADGLHYYRAEDHALELRAEYVPGPVDTAPQLRIGLSSVVWREAWKYGERALRYCQLDIGHAVACFAYAAELLGWSVRELSGIDTPRLETLLGLDRHADFPATRQPETEREEAELLLSITAGNEANEFSLDALAQRARGAHWHGRASTIDRHPMYRWPTIDATLLATRATNEAPKASDSTAQPDCTVHYPPLSPLTAARGAVATILGRRSAQRYDGRSEMSSAAFFHLLDATLPRDQPPWESLLAPPRIMLLLFVHRVEGLTPGIYLMLREPLGRGRLPTMKAEFMAARRVASLDHLDLRLLGAAPPASLQRIARSVSCHQDIGSTSCFSLGMLTEFESELHADPSRYRALYRHAGLLGQTLYLEAEALGYRGTGIGCFFDDAVHELLGLPDQHWQSLYHFAIGVPVNDPRIETTPAYAERAPTV